MNLNEPKRKARARPELSVFDEELNVPFNPKEFLPDVPSHARGQIPSPAVGADQWATQSPGAATSGASIPTAAVPLSTSLAAPVSVPPMGPSEEYEKPRTDLGQSSDKLKTQPRTDLGQSSDKLRTHEQVVADPKKETSDKLKTQPRTELRTDLGQSSDKLRTNGGFFELVGLQREIILFLHQQSKFARDRVTDPIAIGVLAESCNTSPLSAQKTIQRLEKKALVRRVSFRNGRGGWTRYEITHDVFQEILNLESQDKLRTNLGQSQDKLKTQPRTQPRTSLSSSSSFLISDSLKTTTTGEQELLDDGRVQLAPDWDGIDYSPLSEFGFSRSHIIQLAKHGQLSAAEVQDSILFFSFDLKRNGKGRELKGPPVNFFMGILRKGMPYAPPENYESPEQLARRAYLEGKRKIEEQRASDERELLRLEFEDWRRKLTDAECSSIVPEYARRPGPIQDSALRSHFEIEVWRQKRTTIPGIETSEEADIRVQIEQSLTEREL